MAVRHEGDWESWLTFFVRGIAETAEEATQNARAIVAMRERQRGRLLETAASTNALRLLDLLYQQPLVDVNLVSHELDVSFATANKLVDQLEQLTFVREITGRKRDRLFRFQPYLELFEGDERPREAPGAVAETNIRGS
jgi:Fic family protein